MRFTQRSAAWSLLNSCLQLQAAALCLLNDFEEKQRLDQLLQDLSKHPRRPATYFPHSLLSTFATAILTHADCQEDSCQTAASQAVAAPPPTEVLFSSLSLHRGNRNKNEAANTVKPSNHQVSGLANCREDYICHKAASKAMSQPPATKVSLCSLSPRRGNHSVNEISNTVKPPQKVPYSVGTVAEDRTDSTTADQSKRVFQSHSQKETNKAGGLHPICFCKLFQRALFQDHQKEFYNFETRHCAE